MISVIANLLPLIVVAALGGPMWTIIPLLLLRGEGGGIKAAAFAAGATVVRLAQGFVFRSVCRAATHAGAEHESDLITSTLHVVIGLFLLITALKVWNKEEDPDAPPPRWIKMLGGISAPAAFGLGALLILTGFKQWIFTLAAIAVINEEELGQKASVIAYLFFIVMAQSMMLSPIIGSAIAPMRSQKILERARGWLERNNRMITVAASLIFGIWLLTKGTMDLVYHDWNE